MWWTRLSAWLRDREVGPRHAELAMQPRKREDGSGRRTTLVHDYDQVLNSERELHSHRVRSHLKSMTRRSLSRWAMVEKSKSPEPGLEGRKVKDNSDCDNRVISASPHVPASKWAQPTDQRQAFHNLLDLDWVPRSA
jgi:hypothetical protein